MSTQHVSTCQNHRPTSLSILPPFHNSFIRENFLTIRTAMLAGKPLSQIDSRGWFIWRVRQQENQTPIISATWTTIITIPTTPFDRYLNLLNRQSKTKRKTRGDTRQARIARATSYSPAQDAGSNRTVRAALCSLVQLVTPV